MQLQSHGVTDLPDYNRRTYQVAAQLSGNAGYHTRCKNRARRSSAPCFPLFRSALQLARAAGSAAWCIIEGSGCGRGEPSSKVAFCNGELAWKHSRERFRRHYSGFSLSNYSIGKKKSRLNLCIHAYDSMKE